MQYAASRGRTRPEMVASSSVEDARRRTPRPSGGEAGKGEADVDVDVLNWQDARHNARGQSPVSFPRLWRVSSTAAAIAAGKWTSGGDAGRGGGDDCLG